MAWLFGGFSNLFKNRKIDTTYDKCNSEALGVLEIDNYSGIKSEISKTISNNFQISAISFYDAEKFLKNAFCTFCTTNGLFQLGLDQNKNVQLQGTHLFNRFVTKFNTVYSEDKNIFTQINIELNNRFNNLCFKLIKPAIKGASFIYIFNYMQQLGNNSIGAEIISSDSYYSLSFAGRYKKNNSIGSVGLQHFNTLTLDFYRKINEIFEVGLSSSISRDKSYSYGVGCKMSTNRVEAKINVDNAKKIRFSMIDKLTEQLSINMNFETAKGSFTYGYGVNYYF